MYRSISAVFLAVSTAFMIAACGGGGGDKDSDPAVTFNPERFVANYQEGTSQTVAIAATATNPEDFDGQTLYVFIINAENFLSGDITLRWLDDETVEASVQTSSSTLPGHYTGNFTVQLCKDKPCTTQLPGSPVTLPYDITVTPATP